MVDYSPKFLDQASAAAWPFTAIATLLFFSRVYSRARINKDNAGWDDIVLVVSWALDLTRASIFQKSLASTKRVTADNPMHTIPEAAFWVILTDTIAFLSIALPKLAVGILIIRVFNPQGWLKASIWTLCMGLNVLAIVGFIITLVQCSPVPGQWDPFNYPQTKCWDRKIQIIYACSVGGLGAFMDLAFTIYPGLRIWGLQMSIRKKLASMSLMGLGSASSAIAIVKIVSNTTLLGHPDVNQLIYDGVYIGLWNSIENDLVLSAACLPSVPTFFRAAKTYCGRTLPALSWQNIRGLYGSTKSGEMSVSNRSGEAIELASNGQPPGFSQSKAESALGARRT